MQTLINPTNDKNKKNKKVTMLHMMRIDEVKTPSRSRKISHDEDVVSHSVKKQSKEQFWS